MPDLADGERVEVVGKSGTYELARTGAIYRCTCPSWARSQQPPNQRTCKHLRGYLGEARERERTGAVGAPPTMSPRPAWVPRIREDREVRARRRKALAAVLESFPVAYDKMLLVYGLRMPRHLAYAIGFWAGLSRAEVSEAWGYLGTGPCGVSEWLCEGGLDQRVTPGLDERLHFRYRCDPPEMVTVFGGNSDGGHWGLWYDDPAELPRAICHNWARDSAETSAEEATLLGTLREDLYGEHREPIDPEYPHHGAILDWLDECHAKELAAHHEEAIAPLVRRAGTCGGLGPWVPGWKPPAKLGDEYRRYETYRARDPIVDEWIAEARSELAAGQPGLALVIGRDLHWQDRDEWRAVCTELLVGGYRALGRDAIADIVRVHHEHRDLANVGVYATPERLANPFEVAQGNNEIATVARLLAEAEAPGTLVRTLQDTYGEMLALLAPHASPAVVEDAQLHHLEQIAFWHDDQYAEHRLPHVTALETLIDRRGVNGRVLEAILKARFDGLHARALARADLEWRSELGRTVLHVVCRIGHVVGVRALLERGADVKVRDREGETPYDAVRDAWEHKRKEAGEIYDLLRARGGGPPQQMTAIPEGTWPVGTKVTHAKFGEGTVTAATGRGDDAKLTIDFGGASKTLVAKFVKRA